jgi:hypothetical protein
MFFILLGGPKAHDSSGPNEQTGRVHTGEQINFPHLAKNERDMGHPQVWLGKSFKGCSFHT